MKSWSFNVKSSPKEISNKLASALESVNGFVFNVHYGDTNSVTFKMRKRILYAWYMVFHNWTIVNGKLSKTDTKNETDVNISFTQHFLIKLTVFAHLLLGLGFLIAIISGISSNPSMYILAGFVLAVGIVLWMGVKKKFEKDTLKYKTLISDILEF